MKMLIEDFCYLGGGICSSGRLHNSDMLSYFKDVNLSILVVLYEYSYEYNTRV